MNVSVVIPTFNCGHLVVEAVESVLRQTMPAAEIIVVDDGSTDDTEQRLSPFRNRIEYVRQTNGRVAAARNAGLAIASGDSIAFLDADDAWHSCKLQRQAGVLQARPEIGLLATELTPWPGTFASFDQSAAGAVATIPIDKLLVFNPLATSSVIVRRKVLAAVGHFDTELFGPEDYDLWLRCAQATQVAVLREPLTGYRDTQGSLGKQAETMRRGMLAIHAKLDAATVWPSRWLRRKCRAHLDFTTGYMFYAGGRPRQAVRLLIQSLATYPWPISPPEVRCRFARMRLLARCLTSSLRVSG